MAIMDVDEGNQSWALRTVRFFEQLVASHVEWRKRRHQIAELRSLGPGVLKDLGMDCSEIVSVVHGAGRDTSRIKR